MKNHCSTQQHAEGFKDPRRPGWGGRDSDSLAFLRKRPEKQGEPLNFNYRPGLSGLATSLVEVRNAPIRSESTTLRIRRSSLTQCSACGTDVLGPGRAKISALRSACPTPCKHIP